MQCQSGCMCLLLPEAIALPILIVFNILHTCRFLDLQQFVVLSAVCISLCKSLGLW